MVHASGDASTGHAKSCRWTRLDRTCRPRQFDLQLLDRQPPRDTIEVHCLATSTDRKHG
jgi:hypothetical protein